MGSDGEHKVVTDIPQRNQNRILTYIAPIFVILGVLAAGAYYYFTTEQRRAEANEERRINAARARITFKGTLEDCRIQTKTGERVGCEMDVTSTDPAKKIMSFLVQFPVGFHASTTGYKASLNGGAIDVEDGMEYLESRARPFLRGKQNTDNYPVPVPIIIYSSYEFEGQEYSDRSLYYLEYVLSSQHRAQAVPVELLRCGRLGDEIPEIDFLIDPWVEPVVGYDRDPSYSLMFGCSGYALLIHVDRGRFRAQSDVSPGQKHAPRGGRSSYSLSPSSIRFQSASDEEVTANTSVIQIGGPVLRHMPPLKTPPAQSSNAASVGADE